MLRTERMPAGSSEILRAAFGACCAALLLAGCSRGGSAGARAAAATSASAGTGDTYATKDSEGRGVEAFKPGANITLADQERSLPIMVRVDNQPTTLQLTLGQLENSFDRLTPDDIGDVWQHRPDGTLEYRHTGTKTDASGEDRQIEEITVFRPHDGVAEVISFHERGSPVADDGMTLNFFGNVADYVKANHIPGGPGGEG